MFRDWGTASADARRQACLDVIRYFENSPHDLDTVSELAVRLAASGERWTWPEDITPSADVPSTGGPCSLTTLICPYILAAAGCFVPKLSVPGTIAGAIDVLGIIEGFRIRLDAPEMLTSLRYARIAHSANTVHLAPADGELFSIRAECGKKDVAPLVIASLLSKKLAVACETAIFDVRCWEKANFGTAPDVCRTNCNALTDVGRRLGIKCVCVITDNSVPRMPRLGRSESLFAFHHILSSQALENVDVSLRDHAATCISIAAEGLVACGIAPDLHTAGALAQQVVSSGRALRVLLRHLEAQGSTTQSLLRCLNEYDRAPHVMVTASMAGVVARIDLATLHRLLTSANRGVGGNNQLGLHLHANVGDFVTEGSNIASIRYDPACAVALDDAAAIVASAFSLGETIPSPVGPEILAIVGA